MMKPMPADVVSVNMLVVCRIYQILKAFLPSYWSLSACGQMGVMCECRGAKSLAWKMLQGYCFRLTVRCFGIPFTWCNMVRDFLFHVIMYILYAKLSSGLSCCWLEQGMYGFYFVCLVFISFTDSAVKHVFIIYHSITKLLFIYVPLQPILYLCWHEAPWGFFVHPHHQTPQESRLQQPWNSSPVCPIHDGSAWLLHVLLPGPGPAGQDGPSVAWSQTACRNKRRVTNNTLTHITLCLYEVIF